MPADVAPLETSEGYRKVYEQIKAPALQKRLHGLAHDPRIPSGPLRVWALRLLRWRAGDLDRRGRFVTYPVPPSAQCSQDDIALVDEVVGELVPDFRGERWRALRADVIYDDEERDR